jgi:hypothetical protein
VTDSFELWNRFLNKIVYFEKKLKSCDKSLNVISSDPNMCFLYPNRFKNKYEACETPRVP